MSIYRGHVHNGSIQLDEAVSLPEGAAVRVEVVHPSGSMTQEQWREKIEQLCGGWQDDRSAEEIIADIRASRRWPPMPELD